LRVATDGQVRVKAFDAADYLDSLDDVAAYLESAVR